MKNRDAGRMRSGDIDALKNRMRDEGRPMKSGIVTDGKTNVFHREVNGRTEITEKVNIGK